MISSTLNCTIFTKKPPLFSCSIDSFGARISPAGSGVCPTGVAGRPSGVGGAGDAGSGPTAVGFSTGEDLRLQRVVL